MNLAGAPPGVNYTCILTGSAINPNAGTVYRVEWGNGVGTNLYLGNGIVGIGNSASAMSQLSSEATSTRAVTIPNQSGRLAIASDISAVLGVESVMNSTTPAPVIGMSLVLPVGKWAVFLSGLYRSQAASTAILLSALVEGGTQLGGTFVQDPINTPTSTADYGISGMILVNITNPSGLVTLRMASEVNGSSVTLRAGAAMVAVRIA